MNVNDVLESSPAGSHFCLFYESEADLIDLVAPFFNEGLRKKMQCIWVVPQYLGIKGAESILSGRVADLYKHVKTGQFEFMDHTNIYIKLGVFSPSAVLDQWGLIMKRAFELGFEGICVSGDASWFTEVDWGKIVHYETAADSMIKQGKVMALCTYPLCKLDIVHKCVLTACHEVAMVRKDGEMKVVRR